MQLGKEGEAFFLREVLEDEASESIGVSSSGHEHASVSNRPAQGNTSMQALPSKDQKVGPRSGHDVNEFKPGVSLEDFDMTPNTKDKHNSSPKSAHHAMGAGHFEDLIDDDKIQLQVSPKKEDYGETVEEQRKGLWRSIFTYFRGPKEPAAIETHKPAQIEERKRDDDPDREFNVSVDDLSEGYDSEAQKSNESQQMQQDSEIHLSLCLEAFKALEPTSYCEMKELFD